MRKENMRLIGKSRFARHRNALVCALTTALAMTMHTAVHASGPSSEVADDARAQALVSRMTLAEKIDMIRGTQEPAETDQAEAGYLAGVPRLGIPPMRFADGPPGILTRLPSAAPTATMGLAATFSREDARQNGLIIALESKRLGIDVALEPFINIMRDISFGRGWNTFGEDPVLTGTLGAAQISGIQNEGVMAQAKHFIGYDMTGFKAVIGPQALHEIYLVPFADAVDVGVSSLMCSYNLINGHYACGNKEMLDTVLRGQLGFKGFVTSDWGGAHKPSDLTAGLDMEMPGLMPSGSPWLTITRSYFDAAPEPIEPLKMSLAVLGKVFDRSMPEDSQTPSLSAGSTRGAVMHGQFPDDPAPQNLSSALRDGTVAVAAIDRAATRIVHEMNRFGYLDGGTHQPSAGPPDPRIATIIHKTSTDAAVLLKNEEGALPLKQTDYTDLLLVGPGAAQVVALGINAEHSLGLIDNQHSVYELLKARLAGDPKARIRVAVANDMTGVSIPASAWSFDGKPGLARFSGDKQVGAELLLDFTNRARTTLPVETANTWIGDLEVPVAGTYGLYLQVLGSNASLAIDGKPLSHTASMIGARHGDTVQPGQDNLLPTTDGLDNVRRDVSLTAGKHRVEVMTESDSSHRPVQVRLAWMTPAQRAQNLREAIDLASHAKKVVVFAWARQKPLFAIPGDQNAMIEAIATANPNTVVVLNTSLPVAMPWLPKVKGVLNMWWPGDQGGEATADILQGRASPAGRLPFTWAKQIADYPATDPRYPERGLAPTNGEIRYSEGVDVGYRWFDRQKTAPLYPFGYGLSYTHFKYAGLTVSPASNGGWTARFRITNTGTVASDDVPQAYLAAPSTAPPGIAFAVKALAGFDRIHFAAGETKTVTLHVPARSLQYWDESSKKWTASVGPRTLYVGPSSADLPLQVQIR
jgi:beta-glucosidase